MGIADFLKGLFAGGGKAAAEPPRGESVAYKDYTITPVAQRSGAQFLTSGIITKEFPDGPKEHRFIRADTHPSADDAASFAIQKGKQIIDEQGDRIFKG